MDPGIVEARLNALEKSLNRGSKMFLGGLSAAATSAVVSVPLGFGEYVPPLEVPLLGIPLQAPLAVVVLLISSTILGIACITYLVRSASVIMILLQDVPEWPRCKFHPQVEYPEAVLLLQAKLSGCSPIATNKALLYCLSIMTSLLQLFAIAIFYIIQSDFDINLLPFLIMSMPTILIFGWPFVLIYLGLHVFDYPFVLATYKRL